ncbi:MAG: phenylalanine--tRNA ligase beta subunit-related protein [Thermoanaerobaculales bacterium]|nr:phenylalanine--tRNA ligase beta subunit-related protein [Thermoanaerobaculales bacterium]
MTAPFAIDMQLEGWRLFWAKLDVHDIDTVALAARRAEVADAVRARFADTAAISGDPVIAAMRKLFRAAGCDPTRYRPASEALARRLVKGGELPEIFPMVDLNNCLSASLAVPCCVMVDGSFRAPLVWRSGVEGETYESLRGPFNLENKPVLFDPDGPLDTPITGNVRVKVEPDTAASWLVAYMPASELDHDTASATINHLADGTGITIDG